MSPEVAKRKVSQIDTYLSDLKKLSVDNFDDFKDKDRYASERLMMLLIETASDLLSHILKDRFGVKTRSYREVFIEAERNSLINIELKDVFVEFSGFRNKLVHQYIDVSPEEIYDKVGMFIESFDRYIKQVKSWVGELE